MSWSGCNMWCERTDGFTCGDDYCDIEIGLVPEPTGDCHVCRTPLQTGPWGFTDCPACNPDPARG